MAGIVALAALGVAPPAHAALADHPAPAPTSFLTTIAAGSTDDRLVIGICVAAVIILSLLWWKNVIRPGSLGGAGKSRGGRDPSAHPTVAWLIAAVLVFATPMLGVSLVIGLPGSLIGDKGTPRYNAIVGLAGYTGAVACAAFLVYLLAPRAPGAGLRFRWKDLLVGVGAFALTLPVVMAVGFAATAVSTWVNGSPPDPIAHSTLEQILAQRSNPWIIGIIAVAALGAPIQEEMAFRIFLQSALVCAIGSRWAAIFVAGVLFALVHRVGTEPVPWHAIAPIFTLGIASGIAYERTSRPGVPIVIHILFNAANIVLALYLH